MNAPRHDPEELKAALDAFLKAEREEAALKAEREALQQRLGQQGPIVNAARAAAAAALQREGGTVTYAEQFWKVGETGAVTHEAVRVNLDAIEEVKKHKPTALVLKPADEQTA